MILGNKENKDWYAFVHTDTHEEFDTAEFVASQLGNSMFDDVVLVVTITDKKLYVTAPDPENNQELVEFVEKEQEQLVTLISENHSYYEFTVNENEVALI